MLKTADGNSFLSELAQRLDSVSLMAYRNQADKAVAWAAPSISIFESLRKPWRMGVAVDPDANEPTTT